MTGLISLIGITLLILYVFWRIKYGFSPYGYPQVLCYHKISKRFCFEGTWTTPDRFFGHIDCLLERGYHFIGEESFLESLDRPESGAEKALFLTFDDGYSEIFEFILPGLERRDVPFHVFLVTEYTGLDNTWDFSLGRRPFRHLSWTQAREMAGRGVSFGSHGATHRDLTRLQDQECLTELVGSKSAIEDNLSIPVRCFSYPFGRYNEHIKNLIKEAGYQAAFSLYPSHPNERIDRFALRRNGVYIIDTRGAIYRKLERRTLSWFEEVKCRAINGVAAATPVIKRLESVSRNRDKQSRIDAGGSNGR